MSKNRHNPWPASRRFKLPKDHAISSQFKNVLEGREVVVVELPAHGDLPPVKKLALFSDKEMADVASETQKLGGRVHEPEEHELQEFFETWMSEVKVDYANTANCFQLPAPWGRQVQKV